MTLADLLDSPVTIGIVVLVGVWGLSFLWREVRRLEARAPLWRTGAELMLAVLSVKDALLAARREVTRVVAGGEVDHGAAGILVLRVAAELEPRLARLEAAIAPAEAVLGAGIRPLVDPLRQLCARTQAELERRVVSGVPPVVARRDPPADASSPTDEEFAKALATAIGPLWAHVKARVS